MLDACWPEGDNSMSAESLGSIVIISASRRTDIPAFHSEWLMNRLRAGYVLVRNPVAKNIVYRVDLSRRNVDCIAFITKNPMPLEPHLKEIGSMGHIYTFQVTLTPYGKDLEPGVPFKADINDCCIRIADRIGRDRMTWRYDPVILNGRIGLDYHRRKFEMMCGEASQWTDRCIISFVDFYSKLSRVAEEGTIRAITREEKAAFARMAARTADEYGMTVTSCCAKEDLSEYGVINRPCMDAATYRSLNIPYEVSSSPMRERCGCIRSIDIGEYDTCMHDCVYCYANRPDIEKRASKVYMPESEMLWSCLTPRDQIVDLSTREAARLGDYLRSEGLPVGRDPDLCDAIIVRDAAGSCPAVECCRSSHDWNDACGVFKPLRGRSPKVPKVAVVAPLNR